MKDVIQGTWQQLAVQFAPMVEATGEAFLNAAGDGNTLSNSVEAFGEITKKVLPSVVDAANVIAAQFQKAAAAFQLLSAGMTAFGQLKKGNFLGAANTAFAGAKDATDQFAAGVDREGAAFRGEFGRDFQQRLVAAEDRINNPRMVTRTLAGGSDDAFQRQQLRVLQSIDENTSETSDRIEPQSSPRSLF